MEQDKEVEPAPTCVDLYTWAQVFESARYLAINNAKIFNKYTPFSNEVYGEANPAFIATIIAKLQLTPDDVFVDIGSGIGNVVLQVAAQAKCKAYGIEVRPELHRIALKMFNILTQVDALEGIEKLTTFQLGDITDPKYEELLPKCTVVYMHNTCFPATLQEDILKIFQKVLVPGTRVVTLQDLAPRYRPNSLRASTDPMRIFRYPPATLRSMQDAVDWRSKPIHYYIYSVKRSDEEDDLTWSPPSSLSSSPSDSEGAVETPILLDDDFPLSPPNYPQTPLALTLPPPPSDLSLAHVTSSPSLAFSNFNKLVLDAGSCVRGLVINVTNTPAIPENHTIRTILSTLQDLISNISSLPLPPSLPMFSSPLPPLSPSLSSSSSSSSSSSLPRKPRRKSKSPRAPQNLNAKELRASQTAKARAARIAKLAIAKTAKIAVAAATKSGKSKRAPKTKLQQKAKIARQSLKRAAPDAGENETKRKKKRDEYEYFENGNSRARTPKKEIKKVKKIKRRRQRTPIPEKFFEYKEIEDEEYLDGSNISNLNMENIIESGARRERKPTKFINIRNVPEKYDELTAELVPTLAKKRTSASTTENGHSGAQNGTPNMARKRPNENSATKSSQKKTATQSKTRENASDDAPIPNTTHQTKTNKNKRNIPVPEFATIKTEESKPKKIQKTTPEQPKENNSNKKRTPKEKNNSTPNGVPDAETETPKTNKKSRSKKEKEGKEKEGKEKEGKEKEGKEKEGKEKGEQSSDTDTSTDSNTGESPQRARGKEKEVNEKEKEKEKGTNLAFLPPPPILPPTPGSNKTKKSQPSTPSLPLPPSDSPSSHPNSNSNSAKSKKHKKTNTPTPTPITTPSLSFSPSPSPSSSSSSSSRTPSSSAKKKPVTIKID